MTITSYSILYGGILPYSEIWNFCFPNEQWVDSEGQHDWVVNFLLYKSHDGPVADHLAAFHRQVVEKFTANPLFSRLYAINIPHDQVHLFDAKEGYYAAVGLSVTLKKSAYLWNELEDPEIKEQEYYNFLKKFENTKLYPFLQKPRLLVIQNDCACCT